MLDTGCGRRIGRRSMTINMMVVTTKTHFLKELHFELIGLSQKRAFDLSVKHTVSPHCIYVELVKHICMLQPPGKVRPQTFVPCKQNNAVRLTSKGKVPVGLIEPYS